MQVKRALVAAVVVICMFAGERPSVALADARNSMVSTLTTATYVTGP